MKRISIVCGFFLAGTALAQTVAISNLSQPSAGFTVVSGSQALAAPFITGGTNSWLSNVSLALGGPEAGQLPFFNSPGALNVSLYSDASASPGSLLAALSGNSFPPTAGIYVYSSTMLLPLSAHTTYWIVASSIDSTNAAGYVWNVTDSTTLDSGSIWTSGGDAVNLGGGWLPVSPTRLKFDVAIAPPPPVIAISQPIVLTYTNTGYPYVLQQNSDLAATNWVSTTNIILGGVISNQVVILVPPNSLKMFYRLSFPAQ
jgi:hypothetical protein